MDKKAEGPLLVLYLAFVALVIWIFFLAGFINTWVQIGIDTHGLVGLEAFLLANLNLWIGILFTIFILAYGYFARA